MRVAKDRVVLLLFPRRVGVLADVGIVVAGIAGNLGTQEGGAEKLLVDIGELNLGKHESFVVAMKLIHLEQMSCKRDPMPRLVNKSRPA